MSGARVLRVVHPGAQAIEEHRHDCAYIGLFTMGSYCERYDGGEKVLSGPSVAFHPPGRSHADTVANRGLETLTIEFDPAWLRSCGFSRPLDRSYVWSGGSVGLASRRFAATLTSPASDQGTIGRATARFLEFAFAAEETWAPYWLEDVANGIDGISPGATGALAKKLDFHPAYLARAYRFAAGEGLAETTRRRRVEAATSLLRQTHLPLVEVALAAGFCDQSHMNRCFRAVLGRSPLTVRHECDLGQPFGNIDAVGPAVSKGRHSDPI